MELSNHIESLNHEFCDNISEIQHLGYRVDGSDGIKKVVGLNKRKSVDYFCIIKEHCQFVEFSDLARGQEDLLGIGNVIDEIKKKFHRCKLHKLLKQDSKRELVEKFKDSKDIFHKIPECYNDIPEPFSNNNAKVFYIIYAPINDQLLDSDKATINSYLRRLKSQVSEGLDDDICERVKLLVLKSFIQELN